MQFFKLAIYSIAQLDVVKIRSRELNESDWLIKVIFDQGENMVIGCFFRQSLHCAQIVQSGFQCKQANAFLRFSVFSGVYQICITGWEAGISSAFSLIDRVTDLIRIDVPSGAGGIIKILSPM